MLHVLMQLCIGSLSLDRSLLSCYSFLHELLALHNYVLTTCHFVTWDTFSSFLCKVFFLWNTSKCQMNFCMVDSCVTTICITIIGSCVTILVFSSFCWNKDYFEHVHAYIWWATNLHINWFILIMFRTK